MTTITIPAGSVESEWIQFGENNGILNKLRIVPSILGLPSFVNVGSISFKVDLGDGVARKLKDSAGLDVSVSIIEDNQAIVLEPANFANLPQFKFVLSAAEPSDVDIKIVTRQYL